MDFCYCNDLQICSSRHRRCAGCLINNNIISNIILIGVLLQTITITRVAYKLTNNKYGYEEYWKCENTVIN